MLLYFPTILCWLLTKLVEVSHLLTHRWEWNHVRLTARHHPRKHRKKKKARLPSKIEDQASKRSFHIIPTYILPLAFIAFKVGCPVECSMRHLQAVLTIKCLPNVAFAVANSLPYQVPPIPFDMDSFVIGLNTYALVTMGNHPANLKTSSSTRRMTQRRVSNQGHMHIQTPY